MPYLPGSFLKANSISKIREIRKFLIEWQVLNFNRWNIGWAKQILINNYLTLLILGFVFMLILEVELHVVKYYKISRFRRNIRPDFQVKNYLEIETKFCNEILTSWEIWKSTEWTFFVERSSRLDSSVSKFSFRIVQQCDTQLCASWGVKFPSSTTPFFPSTRDRHMAKLLLVTAVDDKSLVYYPLSVTKIILDPVPVTFTSFSLFISVIISYGLSIFLSVCR